MIRRSAQPHTSFEAGWALSESWAAEAARNRHIRGDGANQKMFRAIRDGGSGTSSRLPECILRVVPAQFGEYREHFSPIQIGFVASNYYRRVVGH